MTVLDVAVVGGGQAGLAIGYPTGALRHHRGVTAANGLYVLGQPWQHTTGSALLGFVQHDAAYLAHHLDRRT
jgi:putative flavoprotein involved in K+ transport